MTAEEFYKRLASADELPRTSQPSPDTFAAIFAPYAEAGDEIICVLVASKLSGTCQSALIAAGLFPDANITVIDSRTASIGERLLVSEAVRLRDAGMSFRICRPTSTGASYTSPAVCADASMRAVPRTPARRLD